MDSEHLEYPQQQPANQNSNKKFVSKRHRNTINLIQRKSSSAASAVNNEIVSPPPQSQPKPAIKLAPPPPPPPPPPPLQQTLQVSQAKDVLDNTVLSITPNIPVKNGKILKIVNVKEIKKLGIGNQIRNAMMINSKASQDRNHVLKHKDELKNKSTSMFKKKKNNKNNQNNNINNSNSKPILAKTKLDIKQPLNNELPNENVVIIIDDPQQSNELINENLQLNNDLTKNTTIIIHSSQSPPTINNVNKTQSSTTTKKPPKIEILSDIKITTSDYQFINDSYRLNLNKSNNNNNYIDIYQSNSNIIPITIDQTKEISNPLMGNQLCMPLLTTSSPPLLSNSQECLQLSQSSSEIELISPLEKRIFQDKTSYQFDKIDDVNTNHQNVMHESQENILLPSLQDSSIGLSQEMSELQSTPEDPALTQEFLYLKIVPSPRNGSQTETHTTITNEEKMFISSQPSEDVNEIPKNITQQFESLLENESTLEIKSPIDGPLEILILSDSDHVSLSPSQEISSALTSSPNIFMTDTQMSSSSDDEPNLTQWSSVDKNHNLPQQLSENGINSTTINEQNQRSSPSIPKSPELLCPSSPHHLTNYNVNNSNEILNNIPKSSEKEFYGFGISEIEEAHEYQCDYARRQLSQNNENIRYQNELNPIVVKNNNIIDLTESTSSSASSSTSSPPPKSSTEMRPVLKYTSKSKNLPSTVNSLKNVFSASSSSSAAATSSSATSSSSTSQPSSLTSSSKSPPFDLYDRLKTFINSNQLLDNEQLINFFIKHVDGNILRSRLKQEQQPNQILHINESDAMNDTHKTINLPNRKRKASIDLDEQSENAYDDEDDDDNLYIDDNASIKGNDPPIAVNETSSNVQSSLSFILFNTLPNEIEMKKRDYRTSSDASLSSLLIPPPLEFDDNDSETNLDSVNEAKNSTSTNINAESPKFKSRSHPIKDYTRKHRKRKKYESNESQQSLNYSISISTNKATEQLPNKNDVFNQQIAQINLPSTSNEIINCLTNDPEEIKETIYDSTNENVDEALNKESNTILTNTNIQTNILPSKQNPTTNNTQLEKIDSVALNSSIPAVIDNINDNPSNKQNNNIKMMMKRTKYKPNIKINSINDCSSKSVIENVNEKLHDIEYMNLSTTVVSANSMGIPISDTSTIVSKTTTSNQAAPTKSSKSSENETIPSIVIKKCNNTKNNAMEFVVVTPPIKSTINEFEENEQQNVVTTKSGLQNTNMKTVTIKKLSKDIKKKIDRSIKRNSSIIKANKKKEIVSQLAIMGSGESDINNASENIPKNSINIIESSQMEIYSTNNMPNYPTEEIHEITANNQIIDSRKRKQSQLNTTEVEQSDIQQETIQNVSNNIIKLISDDNRKNSGIQNNNNNNTDNNGDDDYQLNAVTVYKETISHTDKTQINDKNLNVNLTNNVFLQTSTSIKQKYNKNISLIDTPPQNKSLPLQNMSATKGDLQNDDNNRRELSVDEPMTGTLVETQMITTIDANDDGIPEMQISGKCRTNTITENTVQINENPSPVRLEQPAQTNDENNVILNDTPPKNIIEKDDAQSFICGNCKQNITKKLWTKHVQSHYGLTWKDDVEEAWDLKDMQLCSKKLIMYMKQNKIAILRCDKCREEKRSALGYLSHKISCEDPKYGKVPCPHCGKLLKAVSLFTHQQSHCPKLKQLKEQERIMEQTQQEPQQQQQQQKQQHELKKSIQNNAEVNNGEKLEISNSGRAQRRTKSLAPQILQRVSEKETPESYVKVFKKLAGTILHGWRKQTVKNVLIKCLRLNCPFTSDQVSEMTTHVKECISVSDEKYYCKKLGCRYGLASYTDVLLHVTDSHELIDIETFQYVSEKNKNAYLKQKKENGGGGGGRGGGNDEAEDDDDDDNENDAANSSDSDYNEKKYNKDVERSGGVDNEYSDGDSMNENDDEFTMDDDGFDDNDNRKPRNKRNRRIRTKLSALSKTDAPDSVLLFDYVASLKTPYGEYFVDAIKWTKRFINDNYSKISLFQEIIPKLLIAKLNDFEQLNYIPNQRISMKFYCSIETYYRAELHTTKVPTNEWRQLKLFEGIRGTTTNDGLVFYCGGPILSMDWLPISSTIKNSQQILAVSCKNSNCFPDSNTIKNEKCIIQLWNLCNLENINGFSSTKSTHGNNPKLLYAISYDYGPIFDMKFCPSGCYTTDSMKNVDRLGLLACSSTIGVINIFSLPKNVHCSTIEENHIYQLKPSIILKCNTVDFYEPSQRNIIKITWSRAKGHDLIVGAYATGLIVIWNLKNLQSFLLCEDDQLNDRKILLPIKMFYAAREIITQLDIHYDDENRARWLAITQLRRKIIVYDLCNSNMGDGTPNIIASLKNKTHATWGVWPIHWPTIINSTENSFPGHKIVVTQPLNIGFRPFHINALGTNLCAIHFSDWLNSTLYCDEVGDIYVQYNPQLLIPINDNIRNITKALIGYTDIVSLNELNNESIVDYSVNNEENNNTILPTLKDNAFTENGIVFCDLKDNKCANLRAVKKFRLHPSEDYPLARANTILFNPNENSYKYYAIGYESGFVRIKKMS